MKERPIWYLQAVKERENRMWTKDERIQIFKLREKKRLAIPVIADRMKASVIQINNQLRIFRKAVDLRCRQCGSPLGDEEKSFIVTEQKSTLCPVCKKAQFEHKHYLREKALKKGLCGYCQERKVVPGTCACRKCLSATYRRRRKEDLCGRCGKPSKKQVFCSHCIKVNREHRKAVAV